MSGSHLHWHEGKAHAHEHDEGHHGIAFRKPPNVTHVGPSLEEELAASIERAKEKHDAATDT
jgi:hypothetical protein